MQLSTALNLPNRQVSVGGFGYGTSLALDFTNGNQTLDPRITFTRTTTATRTNESGLIESVAINGPRFDYSPTTLAPLGLLIEEQRTNLLTYSEQFDNAAWAKSNASIIANTIIAPDGTLTGDKLIEDTSAGVQHRIGQSIATTTNQAYAFSFYAKAGEEPSFVVQIVATGSTSTTSSTAFNIVGEVISTSGVAGLISSSAAQAVGNGWYRCSVVYTLNGTVTDHQVRIFPRTVSTFTGNGYSGIYIWGAQLEVGAFPTSYIPTVASQVTRAADNAVMTGTNFSSWYNAAEGSFFAEWIAGKDTIFINVFATGTTTIGESMSVRRGSSGNMSLAITNSGVVQANISLITGEPIAETTYKNAVGYQVNNFAAALNGVIAGTDASGTVPLNISTLVIGSGWNSTTGSSAAELLNGHIRKIAYYPRRLSNAELQGITS